jgi:hypothetical protein
MQGYAVIDHLFDDQLADTLRDEVVRLFDHGHMHKNTTHLVSGILFCSKHQRCIKIKLVLLSRMRMRTE